MSTIINRYPVEVIDVVHLADGKRVVLRPVLPQDHSLHRTFFAKLSKQSRYNRFLNPMPNLPEAMLEGFTHVDYQSHFALVAEIFSNGGETVVGEARYIVDADGSNAEFAITVADDFQGAGLGTLLLERLICMAGRAGVRRLVGETLAANNGMLRLARKSGFGTWPDTDIAQLVRLERSLDAGVARWPCG